MIRQSFMHALCVQPIFSFLRVEVNEQVEQRVNIKVIVKLGKNGVENHQMFQKACGKDALRGRSVFNWVRCFWRDCEVLMRLWRPYTPCEDENIDLVCSFVLSDCWMTVRKTWKALGLESRLFTICWLKIWKFRRFAPRRCRNCLLLSKSCDKKKRGAEFCTMIIPCALCIDSAWVLVHNSITVLQHPFCSPHLDPCDFLSEAL